MTPTSELIARLRDLEANATKGPWTYQERSDVYTHILRSEHAPGTYVVAFPQGSKGKSEADARFTAAMRNDILALLDALEEQAARIAELEAASAKTATLPPYAFLVSEQESLNELSPLEVLHGSPFSGRALEACQQRMLDYPTGVRYRRVEALWGMERRERDALAKDVWISVKDRLPEDGQLVAVFDPSHPELKVWPSQYDAENQCFIAGTHKSAGWFERDEVTHWAPLPEPPKDQP